MKALKIYLMVMGGIFTCAILIGIGVWFLYQDLPGANPARYTNDPMSRTSDSTEISPQDSTETEQETAKEPVVYTLTPESLSDGQRAILASFGMGDSSFAVTQPMIDCVTEAMGEERFREILAGSAPSPLEAMTLLPCVKK
jgi:hypothetical protein